MELKEVISRLGLLAAILLITHIIYSNYLYESDLQEHSPIVNLVRELPEETDIIYIGESSNVTYAESDTDKRSIAEFIGDYFPNLTVGAITKPASHAGIYKVLLQQIPTTSKAKTVVITLNLRSFNAQWLYSDLETSLQKSLVLLKPYPKLYNRFLLSFKGYDIKTEQERIAQFKEKWLADEFDVPFEFPFKNVAEWDVWMAINGKHNEKGEFDLPKTELACHFIKTYGFEIDTTKHIRIKDFDEIIDYCQSRDWKVVLNLLPENTEKANKLVDSNLVYFMNKNAEILETYYEHRGITVVNSLNAVKSDDYVDQDFPTEHYNERGRKTVAKNVALALKDQFPDKFKAALNYNHSSNNCQTLQE